MKRFVRSTKKQRTGQRKDSSQPDDCINGHHECCGGSTKEGIGNLDRPNLRREYPGREAQLSPPWNGQAKYDGWENEAHEGLYPRIELFAVRKFESGTIIVTPVPRDLQPVHSFAVPVVSGTTGELGTQEVVDVDWLIIFREKFWVCSRDYRPVLDCECLIESFETTHCEVLPSIAWAEFRRRRVESGKKREGICQG